MAKHGYLGNPLLRCADDEIIYTNEMKGEMITSFEDIIYFGEKYCHIVTIDEGKILIKFWEFQKRMIKVFVDPPKYRTIDKNGDEIEEKKRHIICLCPRQVGKTTLASIYMVHYALFNEDKTIAILANKEKTALEIMRRVKMVYENLPQWMQVGIKDGGWNKSSIHLGNGTRIIAASTASSAIRGETISLLFLDEFSFVPSNVAEEFMSSVYPTVTSGKQSKIIIVSTPYGLNHFYHIWDGAIKGKNNYFPVKIHWWEHPDRTTEFKESVIRDIGIVKWNGEYSCVASDTLIKVRDKTTKEVKFETIGELFEREKIR